MAVYDPRGGGNVHIDKVLTGISMGYENNAFVGDVLAPVVNVAKQSDLYYEFGREGWQQEPDSDLRAPGTPAIEIPGLTVATNPYFAVEHALKIPVTDEEIANADSPLNPMSDGTELLTDKILLGIELTVHGIATTAANYATGHSSTLAGTDQWDDAGSSPILDYRAARTQIHGAIFKEPTVAITPYQVMASLENHADFIERIKYSERGILTKDIIAAVVGVANIVVPGVGYNSANPGQADAFGYIWGKDVVIAYVPPRAGMKIPAYMYRFNWGFGGSRAMLTDRWRDNDRVAEMLRVRARYDHKLIAVDGSGDSTAGYVYKAAVS